MKKKIWIGTFEIMTLILIATIVIFPQWHRQGVILGNDLVFHYNRFYETYMQFKTHHFSFFQSLFGFQQSGRVVNAIYGPNFAYLAGLLLWVSGTWFRFQMMSGFLSVLVAGISMLLLTRTMKIGRGLALCISVLYMVSEPATEFALSQWFAGWGAAFLPLIFIPAWQVLSNNDTEFNPLVLALAMSILLQTHILSSVLGLLGILPFFVVALIISTNRKKLILKGVTAIILTIILCSDTLFGFYDLYSSNSIISPELGKHLMYSATMFSLGKSSWVTIGFAFTIIFAWYVVASIRQWQFLALREKAWLLVGVFFILFASRIVPWDIWPTYFPVLSQFQFATRFAVVGYILLLSGFGIAIQRYLKGPRSYRSSVLVYALIIFLGVIGMWDTYSQMDKKASYWQTANPTGGSLVTKAVQVSPEALRAAFASHDLSRALVAVEWPTPDYLPAKKSNVQNASQLYEREILQNQLRSRKSITKDGQMRIRWYSTKEKQQLVPVFVYKNSTVWLNGKKLVGPKRSDIGSLVVRACRGQNEAIIGYKSEGVVNKLIMIKMIVIVLIVVLMLLRCLFIKNAYRVAGE